MIYIQIAIAAYVVFTLGQVAFLNRRRRSFILDTWKRMVHPKRIAESWFVLACTIAVFYAFYQIPALQWGWLDLLNTEGNNILFMNGIDNIFGIAMILALIPLFPFLAEIEEEIFRKGKHRASQWVPASIIFGLLHLTMGIPLAAGLALIVSGLLYAWHYLRTDLNSVVAVHAGANTTLMVAAIITLI